MVKIIDSLEIVDFVFMFDITRILEPKIIKFTENLLRQNRVTDWLPHIVIKLDSLNIKGQLVLIFPLIDGLDRVPS